jgi:glutamate synthase (NADPH/NADH) small chain
VTIKQVEVSIIDEAFDNGWVNPLPPARLTGKTVAVVGSGPAGLAAAQQLTRVGHTVAVYERDDKIGGLLRYGIPDFKMEKEQVDRRVEQMKAEGTRFRTGVAVGTDVTWEQLRRRYDAVVVCTGATRPRDLPIEGRALDGVHFAMDYLTASTKSLLGGTPDTSPIHARGRHVVVIGGGDTGTDCVATAMRQACKSLVQIEIMAQPPMERAADNPWPEWPRVYKLDYGQEEAASKFGADPRAYLTTVKRFGGDAAGRVKELTTVQVKWERDPAGQLRLQEIDGSEQTQPADLVLLAMGFLGPELTLLEAFGVDVDARHNVKAEHGLLTTSVEGIFAAGDCRRGQSLVVWAINEGRGAARECDRYLMGSTDLP